MKYQPISLCSLCFKLLKEKTDFCTTTEHFDDIKGLWEGGGLCVAMIFGVILLFSFLSKFGTMRVIMDFSTSNYDKVVGTEESGVGFAK